MKQSKQVGNMTKFVEEPDKEYKKIFEELDVNSSGEIPTQLVTELFNKMGKDVSTSDLQNLIRRASGSRRGPGKLNSEEFTLVMTHVDKVFVQEDEVMTIFKRFDRDGDGFISPDELRELLNSMGDEVTDNELSEMIAAADKDGDGKVSYSEFVGVISYGAESKSSASDENDSYFVNDGDALFDCGLVFDAEAQTASTSNLLQDIVPEEEARKPLSNRRKSCYPFASSLSTDMLRKAGLGKKDVQRLRSRSSCGSIPHFGSNSEPTTPKKRLSISASASYLRGIFRKKWKQ